MAIPTSGALGLRECQTYNCSSISCAVAGFACSPASLCSLSLQAGKTAPHGMLEFRGYTPVVTKSVNFECYAGGGSGSNYANQYLCVVTDPAMVIGECFTLNIDFDVYAGGYSGYGYGYGNTRCNSYYKDWGGAYSDDFDGYVGCQFTSTFIVDYNDTATVFLRAYGESGTGAYGSAEVSLTSVSNVSGSGSFTRGSTCIYADVYAMNI